MAELASALRLYGGEELLELTEELRLRIFRAILLLATLLVVPAAVMILIVDRDLAVRLTLLALIAVLCALAAARTEWCFRRLRERDWLAFLPALLGATVLLVGGARQNATFIVVGLAVVGTAVVVEATTAMTAGSILALGYAASILARHQGLLVDGSAGDLAALISSLAAIYATRLTVELTTLVVADVNRDARESLSGPSELTPAEAIVTQEATDRPPPDAVARLSELGLTPAEVDVAFLAGEGFSRKEIAERLGKSPSTVSNQLEKIKKEKLEVETGPELTRVIQEVLGLTGPGGPPEPGDSLEEDGTT